MDRTDGIDLTDLMMQTGSDWLEIGPRFDDAKFRDRV
jgi:hypothetical protein